MTSAKQRILEAIKRLRDLRSERELDKAVADLQKLAPHARLSDLIYYPERDRTEEEIADEALLRETIWAEKGEAALQVHIRAQMIATLENGSIPAMDYRRISAEMILKDIR